MCTNVAFLFSRTAIYMYIFSYSFYIAAVEDSNGTGKTMNVFSIKVAAANGSQTQGIYNIVFLTF